jgi:hypothetical protein
MPYKVKQLIKPRSKLGHDIGRHYDEMDPSKVFILLDVSLLNDSTCSGMT